MASILKACQRAVLWSAGASVAIPLLIPAVMAEGDKPCCCKHDTKIKPSQLPIYDQPEDLYDISYEVSSKGQLQEGVELVRKELSEVVEATRDFRDQAEHIYATGRAHTAGQVDYLLDEENIAARAGAIATGGLLGLLLGARKKGGLIKKVFSTSAGVGGTTAALYPRHTRQYSEDLCDNAATYATVAYNFCVGVKPNGNGGSSGCSSSTKDQSACATVECCKKKQVEKGPSDAPVKSASHTVVVAASVSEASSSSVASDHGQSNPEDADMYTTRT